MSNFSFFHKKSQTGCCGIQVASRVEEPINSYHRLIINEFSVVYILLFVPNVSR